MRLTIALAVLSLAATAPQGTAQQGSVSGTNLTIYNQDFAVARTTIPLSLNAGNTDVTTTKVTTMLEPDSVILRDPAGKIVFKVMEQNYDAAIINPESMMAKFEGKTIDFRVDKDTVVQGKIIRAGINGMPLIEVNGKMQFQQPGTPLYPASTDGLLLKPTLRWQIYSPRAAKLDAEFAYVTRGMNWNASYNVVIPEAKDITENEAASLTAWITMNNNTGVDFPDARIKLMAGDVNKIQSIGEGRGINGRMYAMSLGQAVAAPPPPVTQQAFDDFHLYDLNRTVTLLQGETKQVQFLEAEGISMKRVYEYDGANRQFYPLYSGNANTQATFGTESNERVSVREEFINKKENHLGEPLPAGRIRVYRKDTSGQMEFVGETNITHTPVNETVKLAIGNAFDITGKRKQTSFHVDSRAHIVDESFEVVVKNAKAQPARVDVVEHLQRALNWELLEKSTNFDKRDSNTIVFPVTVPPNGETKVTYSVRYTW